MGPWTAPYIVQFVEALPDLHQLRLTLLLLVLILTQVVPDRDLDLLLFLDFLSELGKLPLEAVDVLLGVGGQEAGVGVVVGIVPEGGYAVNLVPLNGERL